MGVRTWILIPIHWSYKLFFWVWVILLFPGEDACRGDEAVALGLKDVQRESDTRGQHYGHGFWSGDGQF